MSFTDAFDVIDSGDSHWDVQRRDRLSVVGYIWHTGGGFVVWDWADRQIGVFDSLPRALRALAAVESVT